MSNRPLIVATVTAPDTSGLVRERDRVRGADLVELRLDAAADPDVAAAVAGRRIPVVVTCRRADEGGWFAGDEAARLAVLERASASGAEYVDVEWRADFAAVSRARHGRGVVLSHHDFSGVPADLADRVASMAATEAEVIKVAVMAGSLRDNLVLLELGRRHQGRGLVLVAMGDLGLVSRVCAARFGSRWTFAGAGVAPGQLTVETLVREFHCPRATTTTAVYGVAGRASLASPVPAMHNAAFEAAGADAVCVPLASDDEDDIAAFARGFGLAAVVPAGPPRPAEAELVHRVEREQQEWIGRIPDAQLLRDAAAWKLRQTAGTQ